MEKKKTRYEEFLSKREEEKEVGKKEIDELKEYIASCISLGDKRVIISSRLWLPCKYIVYHDISFGELESKYYVEEYGELESHGCTSPHYNLDKYLQTYILTPKEHSIYNDIVCVKVVSTITRSTEIKYNNFYANIEIGREIQKFISIEVMENGWEDKRIKSLLDSRYSVKTFEDIGISIEDIKEYFEKYGHEELKIDLDSFCEVLKYKDIFDLEEKIDGVNRNGISLENVLEIDIYKRVLALFKEFISSTSEKEVSKTFYIYEDKVKVEVKLWRKDITSPIRVVNKSRNDLYFAAKHKAYTFNCSFMNVKIDLKDSDVSKKLKYASMSKLPLCVKDLIRNFDKIEMCQ